MGKHHEQQKFDSLVAILFEDTVLDGSVSIMTQVRNLDEVVGSMDGDVSKLLDKLRRICVALAIPKDFLVRTSEYRPLAKNPTTRGEVRSLTVLNKEEGKNKASKNKNARSVTPLPAEVKKGTWHAKMYRGMVRLASPVTVTEMATKLGLPPEHANDVMTGLVKRKAVRRRKAKQSEKLHSRTKYVYEVAA